MQGRRPRGCVLLAEVLDQHLLGARHDLARDLEPRDARPDHAVVELADSLSGLVEIPSWGRCTSGMRRMNRHRRPAGSHRSERPSCSRRTRTAWSEAGVDDDRQKTTRAVVVDLHPQVREQRRSGVVDAVVGPDESGLLGHEHTPVGRDCDVLRLADSGQNGRLLESCR